MNLTEQDFNKLPPELREALTKVTRDHWGMFYDDEWWTDLEVIEDSVFASVVFRWLVGKGGQNV